MGQRTEGKNALGQRAIVAEALALADAEGLEAVTIRKLAGRLGVTPMALYWHVRNKDDLLDAMAASIFEGIDITPKGAASWQAQLRTLLASLLAVLRVRPAVAPLVSTRTIASEGGLRTSEALLDILARGGFGPAEATQIARHAVSTIANLVGSEPGVVIRNEPAPAAEARQRARRDLESLPPDRYPRLVAAALPLTEGIDPATYYAFGLDLLLAGIGTMAARTR